MEKRSSNTNNNGMSNLDSYFNLVRKSDPFLSSQESIDNLKKKIVERNNTLEIEPAFKPYSSITPFWYFRRFWYLSGTLTIVILLIAYRVINSKGSYEGRDFDELSNTDFDNYSFERISQKREAFIKYLSKDTTDTTHNIQVFFNSDKSLLKPKKIIPTLKVPREYLVKMGFTFHENETVFEANIKDQGYLMVSIGKERQAITINDIQSPDVSFEAISAPLFVSDMNGYQRARFAFGTDPSKIKASYFNSLIDDLIPIAIPHPTIANNYVGIFWFKSTEALFDKLSQEEENAQYSKILEHTEKASKLSITPLRNPFQNDLDIEYTIPTTAPVKINLVSINGQFIQPLFSSTQLEAGSHTATFELSALQRGIYLLQIITPEGKVTKRIIKD